MISLRSALCGENYVMQSMECNLRGACYALRAIRCKLRLSGTGRHLPRRMVASGGARQPGRRLASLDIGKAFRKGLAAYTEPAGVARGRDRFALPC